MHNRYGHNAKCGLMEIGQYRGKVRWSGLRAGGKHYVNWEQRPNT